MSEVPEALRYTKDHEWAKLEGKRVRIGITDYAQAELSDVVKLDLPAVGDAMKKGDRIADIDSVKAASEIYAPVAGTVHEVNSELDEHPEWVNQEPYGKGWIAVLEIEDPRQVNDLMAPEAYRRHIGER